MMGRLLFAFVIFLLSGSYALAEEFYEGFYAGADIGVTNIEESDSDYRNRPTGWKVHAGYEFSGLFALEASYVDSGEAEDNGVTVDITGYVISAVFQTDLTTPNLFTKLGYHNSELEASDAVSSIEFDEDGFAAGLGFRHDLTHNLSIRGEVDWFESVLDNLWSVGVGVQFSFGN